MNRAETDNQKKEFIPKTDWLIVQPEVAINKDEWNLLYQNGFIGLYVKKTIYKSPLKNSVEIIFSKENLEIRNDAFGINKFFYTSKATGNYTAVSNNLWVLVSISAQFINKKANYDFLLFNYFRNGNSFFEAVRYSLPNTTLVINKGKIAKELNRFQLHQQTVIKTNDYSFKSVIGAWQDDMNSHYHSSGNYGITLTGGYDSRMILAGLKKQDIQLTALTFGHTESDDARIASRIAESIKIPHRIDSPSLKFYENFERHAMESVVLSGGLLNPLRMVRLSVFEQWTGYDGIFFGYAGSELLRGLYFDSLLSSRFFHRLNTSSLNRNELKQLIRDSLHELFLVPQENHVDSLTDEYMENPEHQQPFTHLMNTIIPMHFGEDLRYLGMKGITGIAPFLDPVFYNTLLQNNCIGLLKIKKAFQNIPSMDSPLLSASIITKLDSQLAGIPLTKGFSPRDYVFSSYYAGVKWLWHNKLQKRKKQPVTILWPWYKNFLLDFIQQENSEFFEYDKKRMLAALEDHTGNSEAGYLPFTKFLHIRLMEKALKKYTADV